jgi:DNA-binding MarR family transcriptional regulator
VDIGDTVSSNAERPRAPGLHIRVRARLDADHDVAVHRQAAARGEEQAQRRPAAARRPGSLEHADAADRAVPGPGPVEVAPNALHAVDDRSPARRAETLGAYTLFSPMTIPPTPTVCMSASLRMATRRVARHYDRALAPVGITTNGYSILARLERLGPLPLGILAARLGADRSTLSRELAPLVDAGYVAAVPDPADRRRRTVVLSAAGRGLVRQARPLWEEAQASLAAEFGAERAAALVGELNALAGAEP